jgi:RHS repeat-associated protein
MPASPSISFQKDDKGRINRRTLNLGGEAETRRYTYDSSGRLAKVTDARGGLLESYQYDGDGRRLADINPQRFTGERRYTYSLGNRLLQAGRAQYGHDKAGFRNLKIEAGRETRYRYEPSGLLLAVDLPDGRRIEYAYDKDGLRREKRVDGRVAEAFRWLDPLRLEEFHDGREWWRLAYDSERPGRGDRTPVGVTNGNDSYLLLCDQLGTPLALADLDGNVVQTMRYDAFGNPLRGLQGPVRLPLGFAGGLYDADTGLTRFVWRDYDADTGRFTALDPLREKGGDSDWYGYCLDDPVNRVDVWGLSEEDNSTDTDNAGWNIIVRGVGGANTGRKIGGAIGGRYGVKGPGALSGTFLGNAIGMAVQAIAEYPPVSKEIEGIKGRIRKQLEDSVEAQIPQSDDEASEWSSIYDSTPD